MKKNKFNSKQRKKNFDNAEPQETHVFVTNYPEAMSPDAVIGFIEQCVSNKHHTHLHIKGKRLLADGISFYLPNLIEFNLVLNVCGTRIGNKHLWVISLPREIGNAAPKLHKIFQKNYDQSGTLDLSSLATKYSNEGGNSQDIDFTNVFFVEFLFFRIGWESREENCAIFNLDLSNNGINNTNMWGRFLGFVPGLMRIRLTGNPLPFIPTIAEFPAVQILYDPPAQIGWGQQATGNSWNQQPGNGWGQSSSSSNGWGQQTAPSATGWGAMPMAAPVMPSTGGWGMSDANQGWGQTPSVGGGWGTAPMPAPAPQGGGGWGTAPSGGGGWGTAPVNPGSSGGWNAPSSTGGWGAAPTPAPAPAHQTAGGWGQGMSNSNGWGQAAPSSNARTREEAEPVNVGGWGPPDAPVVGWGQVQEEPQPPKRHQPFSKRRNERAPPTQSKGMW